MNLAHFLAVLRARWIPAVIVFVVVMAGAIAYVSLATRVYSATASLLIDAKPDPVSSLLYGGGSPALINSQIEIIRSDRVAQRVVQNMKLADLADLRTAWERGGKADGTLQEWLTNFVENGLDAKVINPGSDVITISYRSADPKFAASLANAYVQAFLETSIELRVDPAKQYSGFFTDQQKSARDALEAAQNKLSAFQKEKGMIGTDDRFDLEMSRLTQLSQELVAVQQQRVDASTRQSQVGNASQMTEVLGNGVVSGLKSELSTAELKLQELSARYGDRHPQVQDARAAVDDLKAKLARATNDITGAVNIDARVSRAREGEIQAEVAAQRAKVLQLKEIRDQGSVLARDVDNAQKSYDLVYSRASETNLESQNKQSNATVISQASPPSVPSSPKVASGLLMGFMGALGLGLGTALLLEQLDKRIRIASDAFELLGIPVIGIMPSPLMNRRLRGQMALTQDRVISGPPAPGAREGASMTAKPDGPDLVIGDGQPVDNGPKSKAIGELIQDARNLSADDLDRIGRYQRENDLRFGEAAIALGLADTEDVLQALAQQFKYAYADEDARKSAPELVMLNQPFGHQAEAFRAIRSQILMRTQMESKGQRRPLAIVSPDSGDGKTFFCANLAVSLAQLGGKVVIVDADMRGARMHHVFGLPDSTGLSGVLSGRGGKGVVKSVPGIANLYVIPVGVQPPNPLELVEGPAFGMLLREVAIKFDHVIVDTPAAVFGSDGVVIASRCGSALVVTRKDANKAHRLQEMVASLQAGQVRLAGVIMNEM